MSIKYLLSWFLILGAAEVGSSLWLLLRAPLDGPTTVYAGFPAYEVGRLICWLPLAALGGLSWFLLNRTPVFAGIRRNVSNDQPGEFGSYLNFILAFAIGFATETFTSMCYWRTPYSRGVRALYESVWYWHRVPRQSDYGWPSFRGYFLDHLILWVDIFVIGFLVPYLWSRRRRAQVSSPATEQSTDTTP